MIVMPGVIRNAWSIRDYRAEDLTILYTIDQTCFTADIAFSKAEISFYLSHRSSITRVAEINREVVGFVMGRIEQSSLGHVVTLDVLPRARRCGIGTKLMRVLHDEFRKKDVSWAVLEVMASDQRARRLYEKFQYRYVETLPRYYSGRHDALRMARRIAPAVASSLP